MSDTTQLAKRVKARSLLKPVSQQTTRSSIQLTDAQFSQLMTRLDQTVPHQAHPIPADPPSEPIPPVSVDRAPAPLLPSWLLVGIVSGVSILTILIGVVFIGLVAAGINPSILLAAAVAMMLFIIGGGGLVFVLSWSFKE